ncbi:hypothetical protein YC2023_043562 [Brassica napus]
MFVTKGYRLSIVVKPSILGLTLGVFFNLTYKPRYRMLAYANGSLYNNDSNKELSFLLVFDQSIISLIQWNSYWRCLGFVAANGFERMTHSGKKETIASQCASTRVEINIMPYKIRDMYLKKAEFNKELLTQSINSVRR